MLIPDLKQVEETTAKALDYFKSTRHIILYYEDIVKNRTVSNFSVTWICIKQRKHLWRNYFSVFQKLLDVQDFLKVPQLDLKSRQVKIHKGPLSNYIRNWDDVQKALSKTPYESLLHADYRR